MSDIDPTSPHWNRRENIRNLIVAIQFIIICLLTISQFNTSAGLDAARKDLQDASVERSKARCERTLSNDMILDIGTFVQYAVDRKLPTDPDVLTLNDAIREDVANLQNSAQVCGGSNDIGN